MKIAEYNEMMAYLTRPEPLPQPKPEELLDLQEQKRKDRLRKTMEEIGPGLMDESVDFIERENFDKGSDYFTKRVTDPTRLKFLNEAAKKFGYDSWEDVPLTPKDPNKVRAYGDREKIAQEATRRQKGVVEGKGKVKPTEAQKANIKKSHWANKSEAEVDEILSSPKYKEYWAKKTQNQADLLKAVKSGKYKTSEDIRKAVGFEKDVFNKEVKNLFKNVYSQIGDLNKPKKVQSRFGVSFLPRDLDEMYEVRSQLGQIEGFESVEQRNIYQQIDEAYGQRGTNPNRKAFAEATKKASDFSRIKNAISAKYPNIKLELDHPLDYKTIKGLGKEGEKFLFVTPVEKSINRGFKATLGDAYAKAVKAKDKANILKIENLAQDIGVTIGQVRGSKVMDYGTGPLRTTNLGDEIIANLRQQNVIVDNIKKLQKSGELKTRLTDIGMPRAGDTGYSTKKVSEAQIKSIKKIIASIACPGKAMGGRIGFQDGTSCFEKGKKMVNSGNIPEGAAKRNFAKFANKAMEIGKQSGRGLRTIAKFGVIPEMIIIGADTAIRAGMGDTFDEAFKRATDIYRFDDAYEQADASEISRRMNSNDGELILNLRKFNNERAKLSSLEQAKEADLALAGDEFNEMNIGMNAEEIEKMYAPRIQKQENNLFNASISDAEERAGLAKETEFADKKGVDFKKKPVGAFLDYLGEKPGFKQAVDLFATEARGEPDVSAQTLQDYFGDKLDSDESKNLQDIIRQDKAKGVLDALKKIQAEEPVSVEEPNIFDQERKILFELAKTDPALAEKYFGPSMTFAGDPIDETDLQDEMNLDRGIYALGGRIGFAKGPNDPSRRTFMKLMAGIMSIPIVGKFLKPAAKVVPVVQDGVKLGVDKLMLLVNKIRNLGTDVTPKLGTKERERVLTYEGKDGSEYELYEDLTTGDIRVERNKTGVGSYGGRTYDTIEDKSTFEIRKGEEVIKDEGLETQKMIKADDEYEEGKAVFDQDGTVADFDEVDDNVINAIEDEIN
jgi:hypothetical protein